MCWPLHLEMCRGQGCPWKLHGLFLNWSARYLYITESEWNVWFPIYLRVQLLVMVLTYMWCKPVLGSSMMEAPHEVRLGACPYPWGNLTGASLSTEQKSPRHGGSQEQKWSMQTPLREQSTSEWQQFERFMTNKVKIIHNIIFINCKHHQQKNDVSKDLHFKHKLVWPNVCLWMIMLTKIYPETVTIIHII